MLIPSYQNVNSRSARPYKRCVSVIEPRITFVMVGQAHRETGKAYIMHPKPSYTFTSAVSVCCVLPLKECGKFRQKQHCVFVIVFVACSYLLHATLKQLSTGSSKRTRAVS